MTSKSRRHHRSRAATRVEEQILELEIDSPAHGGACVARDEDGRVVFVRHTLPGERVRARVTSTQKSLAWADAVDILKASPDRVESVWPQAGPGGVGGGELAHVAPHAQRAWKEKVIQDQLRRIGGPDCAAAVEELGGVQVQAAPGDECGDLTRRRTRIELVIDQEGLAGMHRFRGREVIALDSMPLAVTPIEELGILGAGSAWAELWRPKERIRVVAANGQSPVVLTPKGAFNSLGEQVETERLAWSVEVAGKNIEYRVRPTGFWQTHIKGAEVLANAVLSAAALNEGDRVLELYSGAGLFTRPLAEAIGPKGRLVSLEGDEGAVADAGENLAPFGWVDAFVGGVDKEGISELKTQLDGRPDVIVLVPPRAGAGREACRAIADAGASRIVLVSCDPAAGARDLRELFEAGYRLSAFSAWDLFPHTHHVETLALLERQVF